MAIRRTKIVATLGPAVDSEEKLEALVEAGMNVARINCSHNSVEEHRRRIRMVHRVRSRLQQPVGILLDTRGPEYRLGTFADGRVELKKGETFRFTTRTVTGNASEVSVSYPRLAVELPVGARILVNNGMMEFVVRERSETCLVCEVLTDGWLSDRKSMSFPGHVLRQPYLNEEDRQDLAMAVEEGVEFIACSFVSKPEELTEIREYLREIGGEGISLIAKIENRAGIERAEDILRVCSGLMIGRGDLGVEIPYDELPAIQKQLIALCRRLGKRVITATEMLESMMTKPRPTRAEVSDVANAVYDGTSAVMLSGETAAGSYPVESVQCMSRIAAEAERTAGYGSRFARMDFQIGSLVDAISHAICGLASDVAAKAIVACTISGETAGLISRFRPEAPIVALTTREASYQRLSMTWGVIPVLVPVYPSLERMLEEGVRLGAERLGLADGDLLVITGGVIHGMSGNTNLMKVERVNVIQKGKEHENQKGPDDRE